MRPVVSVQLVGGSSTVRHLPPGARLNFGDCRCGECPYDLPLPGPPLATAGRISAGSDHWRLANHGRGDLVVSDLERPHDMVTVGAGRVDVVIPFELARVAAAGRPVLTVFGPEPAPPVPAPAGCPELVRRRPQHLLDPGATYFAVLVALCEPRLRPVGDAQAAALSPLPTSAEIAHRLRQRGLSVSARAVDSHIDYLLDKLRLRQPRGTDETRRNWRKETLATAAIRRGLVAAEHLPASTPMGAIVRAAHRGRDTAPVGGGGTVPG